MWSARAMASAWPTMTAWSSGWLSRCFCAFCGLVWKVIDRHMLLARVPAQSVEAITTTAVAGCHVHFVSRR